MNPLDRLNRILAPLPTTPDAIAEVVAGDVVAVGALVPAIAADQVVKDLVKGAAANRPTQKVVQHAQDLRHMISLVPVTPAPGG